MRYLSKTKIAFVQLCFCTAYFIHTQRAVHSYPQFTNEGLTKRHRAKGSNFS